MGLIVLSIPIFFVLILIEVIWDTFTKEKLYRLNDALANISCGIFEQVSGLFFQVLLVGLYALFYEYFRIWEVPTTWPWLIVMFLGIDFSYYWLHRHSHTIRLFWMGHVVHHQSEEYNLSVALRQGALQKVFLGWYYMPMAFIGFDPEWFLILNALQTLYQFWIHTEIIDRMGPFGWVFNTPSHHRVHHGRNPKYIDKNHAGTLIIWDRMFGTFQREEERPVYGVTQPIETFDPVEAHVLPLKRLGKDLIEVPGFLNKIKLLFKPPGWYPEVAGGPKEVPVVSRQTYKKYNVKVPKAISIYCLVQYLGVLGFTALFLFTVKDMTLQNHLTGVLWIVIGIMAIGSLIGGRKRGYVFEILRLITIPVLIFIMFRDMEWFNHALTIGAAYSGVMLGILFWLMRSKTD